MPVCPHCGQEIGPVAAPNLAWWRLDMAPHGVSLGCGSLILIAIIVAICSGGGGLSSRIERLDNDVQNLEHRMDELTKAVDRLAKKP
jgi:hypothetical protein